MSTGRWELDRQALIKAVEQRRSRGGLTWDEVSEETGLAAPMLRQAMARLRNGGNVTASTLATLGAWTGEEIPYTRPAETARTPSNMDPLF